MYNQTNSFVTFFYNLESYKKIYAYDILKELNYKSEKGSNVEELYFLFKNRKRKLIRNIICELDGSLIICKKEKCIGREHRYFITKEGIEIINEYFGK
ncbi:MAG TPA: hypothetical protein VIK72_05725 [Clostridiaceae bacterium]